MSDDSKSASELRAAYARGGNLDDSQLTASQLRARHGVQSNSKDFSTRSTGEGGSGGGMNPVLIALLVVILLAALIGYILVGRFGKNSSGHEEL